MTVRVDIAPELLLWACDRVGWDRHDAEARFKRFGEWVDPDPEKRTNPTLKQVEKFAAATHTPVGYLFLPEPPEEELPLPDFRTLGDAQPERPSPDLLDSIYTMQRRQAWLRETLIEDGADPLSFVGSARVSDDPEAVAAEMRRAVGLDDGWARSVRTWQEAVSALRRAIEQLGVMAVINGIVGNNTHRRLDVAEFRGFAISDPYAPLIFVNGADAKSAQMFMLAHELAHIWLGVEALSGFEALCPGGFEVEEWCNKAAAELLVPARSLKTRWPEVKRRGDRFQRLARDLEVSPIVAARRALDLRLIGRDELFRFYRAYTQSERAQAAGGGGGDFYKNQNTRVGDLLGTQVVRAALEGRVGFKEAYDLTGLQGGAFKEYASRLGFSL